MMKLLKILMLSCICASTYANNILASYLEWQSVSSAKGTYNIVLSLYVDEASEAHKLAAQHVHLFRDDDHWKANGQRIPFGFFALKRLSSTKIEQDTTVCSNTAKPNIFLDVYVSISPVSIDPVFRANGYFLTWNPRLNRGGDDVNIANSGNFEECVITYIPPLTAESTDHSSSPAIGELKTFYVCKDKYSTIQLPAIDKDGDALKYKLASPIGVVDHDSYLEDVDLIWANGCNGSNQMMGSPGLQVDENSGLLSVTPDKLGQHLVGIAVEEYRNGKKLGAVIVYYTIVVTECKEDIDPDPQIYSDTTAVTTLTICQGSEATLSSHQSFPDPQPQFQWTKDGKVIWGATSQSIAVSEAGEYQLSTTKIAGCPDSFDSETVQVIVGSSSGAEMASIHAINRHHIHRDSY